MTDNKSIYKLENDRPASGIEVGTFTLMDVHDLVETYYMIQNELSTLGILTDID